MVQSVRQFTAFVNQWQSPVLIPMVLKLLKTKLNDLDEQNANSIISPQNIPAYQTLYQHWRKSRQLDPIQQIWVKEIGGYLRCLKNQSIFNTSLKNKKLLSPSEKTNSFKL
ncbi:MAG: hypothetical protein JSR33_12620 [Proteobacteria bacterium]|nr:hypothetical protein [Pseudomonadota bacterium]